MEYIFLMALTEIILCSTICWGEEIAEALRSFNLL